MSTENIDPTDPTNLAAVEEVPTSGEETTLVETEAHKAARTFLTGQGYSADEVETALNADVRSVLAAKRDETTALYVNSGPNNEFLDTAIQAVRVDHAIHGELVPNIEDLFVVWFAKTLGNWKALVGQHSSTAYFEVTFNGAKNEVYVDFYEKRRNTAISGAELATYGSKDGEPTA